MPAGTECSEYLKICQSHSDIYRDLRNIFTIFTQYVILCRGKSSTRLGGKRYYVVILPVYASSSRRHPIDPLPWGVIGHQRQIDQTRLKIDAQPASQCVAHLRNDDHPASDSASRHRHHTQTLGMRVGTLPTSLVQTASSIEACSDHV